MIVHTVLMYIEFDKTIDKLVDNVVFNTSSAKKHVDDIEITI